MATFSNQLTADVSFPSLNTYVNGPSVTITTAGTYLVVGTVTLSGLSSVNTNCTARLLNGSTVVAETEGWWVVNTANSMTLTVCGIVTTTGTATVKIEVACSSGSGVGIRATCPHNGTTDKGSTIVAFSH